MLALVSTSSARGRDRDLEILGRALAALGAKSTVVDWEDSSVEWAAFDAAFIRSTWNYHRQPESFLNWVRSTAAVTRLVNPPAVVEWNLDKRYLREVAAAGVPILETTFVDSREAAADIDLVGDLVVKPAISAGANDTKRHTNAPAAARAHLDEVLASGRAALVQPYAARIDEEGETGVVCAEGEISHGFRKAAILSGGDATHNGLFVEEEIGPRVPTRAEWSLAELALAALEARFGFVPTYARIDMVGGVVGVPRIMEIELIEPSLFLHTDDAAAERVARAFLREVGTL